ncbi:MAG: Na+/H+ antiporter subunit D [Anaerolineales bacterium]|nr:Na+/H+ antiporter subunit D [Anaerolineales bacterium]MBX3035660.1 Na+/H+ antiporter subunit D [Anaerolineales bacterium]
MNILLPLPIIIPLLTGIVALLAYRSRTAQRWLNVTGSTALLIATIFLLIGVERNGIYAVQIAGWLAPYGITLVADLLSAIMLVLVGIIGLAVAIFSLADIEPADETFGFHQLYQFLLMGVCGAFLTGDLFNLYVWFEVMLMASFVLLALGGDHGQMQGALKYVTINLVSSAIFLAALGLLYGTVGTLNMADVADKFSKELSAQESGLINTLAILFLIAFGIKAAIFPLFFWLPDSYHTPSVSVSAVFSGLLTKVGVYALIRVFTLVFVQDMDLIHNLILIIAGLTMVTGVLGAASQMEFRRVLSFHIISQIGFMIMGLGLFTPIALAGSVFYIVHHIIVKSNLFLISGVVKHMYGTLKLKEIGGLYKRMPILGILFLVVALSLAGFPPLSGFFAKFGLIREGLVQESYFIVFVSLVVGLLTLFSMIKIWNEVFWKELPEHVDIPTSAMNQAGLKILFAPIVVLAFITILIGLGASPIFDLALRAGEQLLNPSIYIRAVLGDSP